MSETFDLAYDQMVTGRPMPRITAGMRPAQLAYYRIHFQDDGYPAQRSLDGKSIFDHPILPTYVIGCYEKQYNTTFDPALLAAVELIADAAIRRMSRVGDTLVFWYEGDLSVARAVQRHPSGLTQGYYIGAFEAAARMTHEERFEEAAEAVARSLLTPVEEGGVARHLHGGSGIEECPVAVPDLVLNGWQSALVTFLKSTISRRPAFASFTEANIRLLKHLTPRYDREDIANTAYSLGYPTPIRFRAAGSRFGISDVGIVLDGVTHLAEPSDSHGWRNTLLTADMEGGLSKGAAVRANLILTNTADRNEIAATIESERALAMTVEAMIGRFDPVGAGPVDKAWKTVATVDVPAGKTSVSVAVPPAIMDDILAPTNFMKKIGGERKNVYHVIHTNRMAQLYTLTGDEFFLEWAKKWAGYVDRWSSMPLYAEAAPTDHRPFLAPSLLRAIRA